MQSVEKNEFVLFDNYGGYDFDEVKEEMIDEIKDIEGEYKEYCECCGNFIGISDEDVWKRIDDDEAMFWDDMKRIINAELNNEWFVAIGKVGSWRGTADAGTIQYDFDKFLQDIGKDCDYWRISVIDGVINIECTHHDGTNYWELKPLSKSGEALFYKWNENENDEDFDLVDLSEKDFHLKLFNNDEYSLRVDIA